MLASYTQREKKRKVYAANTVCSIDRNLSTQKQHTIRAINTHHLAYYTTQSSIVVAHLQVHLHSAQIEATSLEDPLPALPYPIGCNPTDNKNIFDGL